MRSWIEMPCGQLPVQGALQPAQTDDPRLFFDLAASRVFEGLPPLHRTFRNLQAGLIDTLAHRIIPRWKDFDPAEPDLYKTHESDRVLDYILLNSAAHRELVIGSAHIYGTLYDENYDWKTDPYPKGYAADHYPVIIDLVPRDVK